MTESTQPVAAAQPVDELRLRDRALGRVTATEVVHPETQATLLPAGEMLIWKLNVPPPMVAVTACQVEPPLIEASSAVGAVPL